jgi:hypothetical protein
VGSKVGLEAVGDRKSIPAGTLLSGCPKLSLVKTPTELPRRMSHFNFDKSLDLPSLSFVPVTMFLSVTTNNCYITTGTCRKLNNQTTALLCLGIPGCRQIERQDACTALYCKNWRGVPYRWVLLMMSFHTAPERDQYAPTAL